MIAVCVKCKARLAVPDERVKPDLRLKCPGCGLVFPLGKARRLDGVAAPVLPDSLASDPRSAAASASTSGTVRRPTTSRGARFAVSRPHCSNHAAIACAFVCEKCESFYCDECVQRVQGRPLCGPCQFFVAKVTDWEAREAVVRRRARPLMEDLRSIMLYPFSDPIAFAILAVIVWLLNLSPIIFGPVLAFAFLMAYAFRAVSRVSDGDMVFSVPDVSDLGDLLHFFFLGIASFLVSWGPFSLAILNLGGSILTAGARGTVTMALVLAVLGFLWGLLYAPMALVVAAISDTFLETLNPLVGIRTIQRMGTVYWQAAAIYTSLVVGQLIVTVVLGGVPILGSLIASALNTYVYIAAGCALGLAVDKKAEELGYG